MGLASEERWMSGSSFARGLYSLPLSLKEITASPAASLAAMEIVAVQVLAQGLLALSCGCGREPRHAGAGSNQLHTSLLEIGRAHV